MGERPAREERVDNLKKQKSTNFVPMGIGFFLFNLVFFYLIYYIKR